MSVTVVVGTQWGDEGKGKAVDVLAQESDAVVRFQGGNNAGHTLVVNGEKTVLHLIPSGALVPDVDCYLARGVVIDPEVLLGELDALKAKGIDLSGRFFISRRAPLILPWHKTIDALRESRKGAIGTTRRGIGPAYEQFTARQAVLAGDLLEPARAEEKLETYFPERHAVIAALHGEAAASEECPAELATRDAITRFRQDFEAIYSRLQPFITDVEETLQDRIAAGDTVLMEGAQGTFLDLGMGTYPFVTSSHTTAAGACTGAGIAPRDIDHVLGICKAYTTRVGDGPFPTELAEDSPEGAHLRAQGHEFGATTGRPRRCGWLDLTLLKRAVQLNGCDGIFLTKLDVLSGLKELRVAVDTDADGSLQYVTLPGWEEPITAARSLDDLPAAARRYVEFIDDYLQPLKSRLSHISVGPGRSELFRVG